jgi:HAMP domain-containing protein
VLAFRAAALNARRLALKDESAPIVEALNALNRATESGAISRTAAQREALVMLRSIRFGNNDYFFTYNRDLVAISHPDPKFQGKNLTDMQDADGKYVLREIREVALEQGSGYVDYQWVRLGQDKSSPKLGYVFHYEPWDWIIGTGVYIDDIDNEADRRLNEIKMQLRMALADISFSDNSLFYVVDGTGAPIIAPFATNIDWLSTPEGAATLQQVLAAAPTADGEISEVVLDQALRYRTSEPWVLNVSTFKQLDWYLVSAVPQAELTTPGQTLALQQAALSVAVLVFGLFSGLLMSRRIVRPVEQITSAARALTEDRFDPADLDSAAERADEVGELARVFQRMGRELVERERALREQVRQLKVEIDRNQVAKDVSAITDSDYFQDIRAKAAEMRRQKLEREQAKNQE